MEHLARAQNSCSAEGVLQDARGSQIDLATEKQLQLPAHVNPIERAVRLTCIQSDQHINVAAGIEVIAQDRSKKGKLLNAPAGAEFRDLLPGHGESIRPKLHLRSP